jgi:hypothetical protein
MRLSLLSSLQDFLIWDAEDHGLSPMATTFRHYRGFLINSELRRFGFIETGR